MAAAFSLTWFLGKSSRAILAASSVVPVSIAAVQVSKRCNHGDYWMDLILTREQEDLLKQTREVLGDLREVLAAA